MSGKPSFQFYPGDWLRDNISGCSLAAQGLWLRMLLLAHDSERPGYLTINGSPMQAEFIARKCGCSLPEFETLLDELFSAQVPSRHPDGTIFSRRMVKDEKKRKDDTKRQREHRSKERVYSHGDVTHDVTVMSHASSSSSSPSSSKTETERERTPLKALPPKGGRPPPESRRFSKPSPAEVTAYAASIGAVIDGQAFCDFYESKGWRVGNTPMRDWMATVRTWKSRGNIGMNGNSPRNVGMAAPIPGKYADVAKTAAEILASPEWRDREPTR